MLEETVQLVLFLIPLFFLLCYILGFKVDYFVIPLSLLTFEVFIVASKIDYFFRIYYFFFLLFLTKEFFLRKSLDNLIFSFKYFVIFCLFFSSIFFYNYFTKDEIGTYDSILIFTFAILGFIFSQQNINKKLHAFLFNFSFFLPFFLIIVIQLFGAIEQYFLDSKDNSLVYLFLNKPLNFILSSFGFDIFSESDILKFRYNGETNAVSITTSCSGLYSIFILCSAICAYLLIDESYDFVQKCVILFLCILIMYLSNLLRMFIIVLAGIFYGIDTLLIVHTYLGSVLFFSISFFFISYTINTSNLLGD